MPDDKLKAVEELRVLPADDPKGRTIGFTCREYNGVRIHRYDGATPERDDDGHWIGLEPITEQGGIKAGDKVLVHGLFGELYIMDVEANEHGTLHAKGERLTGILKFGEDDRNCWVCLGLVNLRGVTKMELMTDG